MTDKKLDPQEIEGLKKLIARERELSEACQELVGETELDRDAYRSAFRRFLEVLPDDSRLKVSTSSWARQTKH